MSRPFNTKPKTGQIIFIGRDDEVYFNTTIEDRVQTSSAPMIGVEEVISLPKGQAFILSSGGNLYKVRLPLMKPD